MAEYHRYHHHDQEQYFSSLRLTHEGATIVNIGVVFQNHDQGHHCNAHSSWTTTSSTTTTSAPNPSWLHIQNHPAMSPVNETVNLAGHNNTFNFVSSPPEPRAAEIKKNAPHRRCNGRNCAKLLRKRWAITTLITLVVVLVAVGGLIYSVKPNKLKFTIEDISIQGFSTTINALSSPSLSNYTTSCNITMKVRNPNKLFGIYHDEGSLISVHHRNTELFHGAAPSLFYQKAMNETTLKISLKNDSSSSRLGLLKKMQDLKELGDGVIPLDVRFGARSTFKFSSVSIKVTIWADCRLIVVNALAVDSKILSQHCPVTLDFVLFAQHFKL